MSGDEMVAGRAGWAGEEGRAGEEGMPGLEGIVSAVIVVDVVWAAGEASVEGADVWARVASAMIAPGRLGGGPSTRRTSKRRLSGAVWAR